MKNEEEDNGRSADELTEQIVEMMREASIREEVIYAFKKTGKIVTEDNKELFEPEELQKWNDAVDEYRAHHQE